MEKIKIHKKNGVTFRMKPDTYYIWCGGSCNYASKRRESGGAYIMEKEGMPSETYVISDIETTEFRMILQVMIHAMEVIPEGSEIVFLTNVAYIQNFDMTPSDKSANADLIKQCIALKSRHKQVSVKVVSYHKYHQLPRTHELAHEAMREIMEKGKSWKQKIIDRINQLASQGDDFLFVINYLGTEAYIKKLSEVNPEECLYDFEGKSNVQAPCYQPRKLDKWQVFPPSFEEYKKSFEHVKDNILAGNSYLTNLTCQVKVECNLSLMDIFQQAKGKYKLLLLGTKAHDKSFVCFSPETFVKIKDGRIYSYPMKGTIDAAIPNAKQVLLEDKKEAAEHATIVDLIRNDLSRVATEVRVDKYRYVDVLHTNKGNILQTSSEISGKLSDDYQMHIGEILDAQLPAGSITGAPKDKTLKIISEAETYQRRFYTGIMGIYQQGELNSAVMIRFLEDNENGRFFKAGGGITSKSDCRKEYEEVIQKIYLPFT